MSKVERFPAGRAVMDQAALEAIQALDHAMDHEVPHGATFAEVARMIAPLQAARAILTGRAVVDSVMLALREDGAKS